MSGGLKFLTQSLENLGLFSVKPKQSLGKLKTKCLVEENYIDDLPFFLMCEFFQRSVKRKTTNWLILFNVSNYWRSLLSKEPLILKIAQDHEFFKKIHNGYSLTQEQSGELEYYNVLDRTSLEMSSFDMTGNGKVGAQPVIDYSETCWGPQYRNDRHQLVFVPDDKWGITRHSGIPERKFQYLDQKYDERNSDYLEKLKLQRELELKKPLTKWDMIAMNPY